MNTMSQQRKLRRATRVRAKISGTPARPRLSVFRSLKHISASLIDDTKGITLCTVSDLQAPLKTMKAVKAIKAQEVGKVLGKKAKEQGITKVVFDRGARAYHGRVQAVATGARSEGLQF